MLLSELFGKKRNGRIIHLRTVYQHMHVFSIVSLKNL